MSTGREWIESVSGEDSLREVSKKIGFNYNTLYRQVTVGELLPQTVVSVARAYNADILEGFVAIGLITEQEKRRYGRAVTLESFTDLQLAEEAVRRALEYNRRLDGSPVDETRPVTLETEKPAHPKLTIVPQNTDEDIIDETRLAAYNPGYSIDEELEGREENQP